MLEFCILSIYFDIQFGIIYLSREINIAIKLAISKIYFDNFTKNETYYQKVITK